MKSGFDYKEYEKWVKKLGIATSQFNIWLRQFLLEQAQRCVAECKKRQRAVGAIDTGAMINSWYIGGQEIALKYYQVDGKDRFELDKENSQVENISMVNDNLTVVIGNSMDYASFIEYGQRSYQGKYILTISIDIIQQALPGRFEKQWQLFLKNGGII